MSDLIHFNEFALTLHVERLIGGIPRHPEIVKRWQEARWPKNTAKLLPGDPQTPDEAAEKTVAELGAQAMLDEEKGIWTGFAEHDGFLAIEERQVKAMFKESANILRPLLPIHGKIVPLRNKLAERVFVRPHWLSLGVTEPTDTIERPIHVMTMQGPRTALKRTDYVDDVTINCTLRVLDDGMFKQPILEAILTHAAENGIGTDRSQGNGVFTWELRPS